jgi:hypothetical protein
VQSLLANVGRIQSTAGKDFDTSIPQVPLKYAIPLPAAGMLAPGVNPTDPPRGAKRQMVRKTVTRHPSPTPNAAPKKSAVGL